VQARTSAAQARKSQGNAASPASGRGFLASEDDWAKQVLERIAGPPSTSEPIPQASRQVSKASSQRLNTKFSPGRTSSKISTGEMSCDSSQLEDDDEQVVTPAERRKFERTKSKGPCSVAFLAHQWSLPMATMMPASILFRQYAKLPNLDEIEDILRDGVLHDDDMKAMVCALENVSSMDQLSAAVKDEMTFPDTHQNFREFTNWYNTHAFLECFNLSAEQMQIRSIGDRLGLSPVEMDNYKDLYHQFDTDHSGEIDMEEFRQLMHILMKVPRDEVIPESRVLTLWSECDTNGSGLIDLEEFVTFYLRHFDKDAHEPMTDYYQALRRVPGHEDRH